MLRVDEAFAIRRATPVVACDFSPPRGSAPELLADAAVLQPDFFCVAYSPGKAVRVDSLAAAEYLRRETGRDVIFNLSPRDMNLLALQSHLLGADLLGLRNVLVVQGDAFVERDRLSPAGSLSASGLIRQIAGLNQGLDFKGLKLRNPTSLCIGASLDLGKGVEQEAALALRKVKAGAQFLVTQPVFDAADVLRFHEAYASAAGVPLDLPLLWGLQVLARDGVLFSSVPQALRDQLEGGRDGVDIALETYEGLRAAGVRGIYLVSPIMRGGARDYAAGARVLQRIQPA